MHRALGAGDQSATDSQTSFDGPDQDDPQLASRRRVAIGVARRTDRHEADDPLGLLGNE